MRKTHRRSGSLLSSRMAGPSKTKAKPISQAVCAHTTAADMDALLAEESAHRETQQKRRSILQRKLTLLLQIGLIILCVYMSFLIYGVCVTRYIYTEQGQVAPEVLSVSDMYRLSEYETFSTYYLRARILYEETMRLDYRLSIAPDSALVVAMEYTELLDDVAKLSVDISAADYDTGYSNIYGQLLTWVKTDIAVYLQNIAGAITENDGEKANNALISRDVMYADFSTLTANAVALAKNTKGVDNLEIYNWSPDSFSAQLAEGA